MLNGDICSVFLSVFGKSVQRYGHLAEMDDKNYSKIAIF